MNVKHKRKDLYEVTEDFVFKLEKLFNDRFKIQLNNLSKSYSSKLIDHINKHQHKIRESIFTSNLESKILLILMKNNCVCIKGKYCFYCGNDVEAHKKTSKIITPSNWDESKLYHAFRDYKSKKRKKGVTPTISLKYKSENTSCYVIGSGEEKNVDHKSIFELPNKLPENTLFDKTALNKLSGTNRGKNKIPSLMTDVIQGVNTTIDKLIDEAVSDEMKFYFRIIYFFKYLEVSEQYYSDSFIKRLFPVNEGFEFINEGLKFIETTTGAGIFYLRNTQFTGCISFNAVRKYMHAKETNTKYKFTEDHIYRRKLVAKFLLKLNLKNEEDLYEKYTKQFSFISLLDSAENSAISKVDVKMKTIAKEKKDYLKFYTTKLAKKPYKIKMIKTKIKSKSLLKGYIKYLMKIKKVTSKSTYLNFKSKLKQYIKISDYWVN